VLGAPAMLSKHLLVTCNPGVPQRQTSEEGSEVGNRVKPTWHKAHEEGLRPIGDFPGGGCWPS
jgi:hypothetical protein